MKIATWIFFLGSISSVWAQQFSLHRFSAIDGLPQSEVNAMVEDKLGYLWIGTAGGGLARFDGKNFKVYTTLDGLLSNMVTSLMIDSEDNIWIMHPRGISKFNGTSFITFLSPGISASKGRLRRLYQIGDSVFFTSAPGVLGKIFKDSVHYWFKPVEKNKLVFFGIKSTAKDVYFYLSDSTFLIRSQTGSTRRISHKDAFSRVFSMFNFTNKVVLSTEMGYYQFSNNNLAFEKASLNSKNRIVAFDEINNVMWTRYNNDLLRESPSGKVDTVLQNLNVAQLLFDSEGNTWIGTSGSGLFKYSIRDFEQCGSPMLGSVSAIFTDRGGTMWLSNSNGDIWKIKKGKIESFRINSPQQAFVTSFTQTKSGEIWAASMAGLGRFDSVKNNFKWLTREDGLTSQSLTSIISNDNNLWIGSIDGGLMHYNGKTFKSYITGRFKQNVPVRSVHYMKKIDRIFIGTDVGLSQLKNDEIETVPLLELNNSAVLTVQTFRDSLLLIGSSGAGVLIINPIRRDRVSLSTKDGLRSNLIYFAAADRDYLWIGTEQGIHRIKLSKDLQVEQNQHYGYNNGLTGVETNHNAYNLGQQNFFGLIDGLYQFSEHEVIPQKSNDLHLTSVEIFYEKSELRKYSDIQEGFFKIPQGLILPSDKNHITFSFSRVDKRNPESVRYKYFLKNFDKAWSPASALSTITYGNLPPGEYTFQVKATDKKGSWDVSPLQYSFVVKAPFYQSAYFIISMFFLVVSMVILYFYWKIRQRVNKVIEVERIRQQEQEVLRKQIARDFHDEMGNQLTRIINYVSLIKISKNGQVMDLYNKVEESAKYLYSGTRDFIWSIDPVNDELSKLFIHTRDFGEKLFEEKSIDFRAFNEIKDTIKLPYGFCRDANLIFKEAMTNAFNHSGAKNVSFCQRKVGNTIEIVLEDDGKGFDYNELTRSNGLKNMRSRAERIRAVLRINAKRPDGGTSITLQFESKQNQTYGTIQKESTVN